MGSPPLATSRDTLVETFVELIRRAATDLPADVEAALRWAESQEEPGSAARSALLTILDNVALARDLSRPICQDTGTLIFHLRHPRSTDTQMVSSLVREAAAVATNRAYLRPNAVDPITGANSGDNTGAGFPTVHYEQWDQNYMRVDLVLKGGGSENVSAQYSLPHVGLGAGRDLEGVRKVVLDAVFRAQGKGCAPGILGIAIGGDRGAGYVSAKYQLLRPIPDTNPLPVLAALEDRLLHDCNALGIGPMGFGGRTTVLGVKVGALHRLPACYFVTIAYMCWACRRATWDQRLGFGPRALP